MAEVLSGYASVLQKARNDLASAKAELFKLEARIASLQRTVLALASLVERPDIDPAAGLTEGIKGVLEAVAPSGLYPTTIRLKLEEAGFDFSTSRNPLAAIHSVLKRLTKQGYIEPSIDGDEAKIAYYWQPNQEAQKFMDTFRPENLIEQRAERLTTITLKEPVEGASVVPPDEKPVPAGGRRRKETK